MLREMECLGLGDDGANRARGGGGRKIARIAALWLAGSLVG